MSNPRTFGLLGLVSLIIFGWGVAASPVLAQNQPQVALGQKNILVLHALESNVPIFELTDRGLRAALDAGGVGIRNQFFEYLDLQRNPGPEYRKHLAELIRLRYGQRKIDFIITMYPEALLFALNEGRTVSHEAPILALYLPVGFKLPETEQRVIRQSVIPEIAGTLEIALKLVPEAKRVYVVAGMDVMDRWVEDRARQDLKRWESKLEFRYLSDLPLEEILTVVSSAPPGTIVLLLVFTKDVAGRNYTSKEVSQQLGRTSKAPVFGLSDTFLGDGIAGGSLVSYEHVGTRAGELALDILRGNQNPENIPTILEVPHLSMFDWRQLTHWNLDVDALPRGSIVINREFTIWDHKDYVIGALVFCLAETALIIILLAQRRRRRSAEQSLRQKTEEQDQFFNVSLDLLSISNTDGYFLRLNPVWEKILGYSRDELTSKRFMEFVHPDDVRDTQEALAALSSQKAVTYFVNRYRCKDGTYRWLEWSASPAGRLIYSAARDITERKQAEEALRASEQRFKAAFTTGADAYLIVTRDDGMIREVNGRFLELYGYSREEVIGRTSLELGMWAIPEAREDLLERIRSHGHVENFEVLARRKGGETFWVLYSVSQLKMPGPPFLFGAIRDITGRKRTEEELRKHRDHLEDLIKGRTAELAAAKEQAETANQAKSTFLANMSHELRTPLNSILGIAQLMERDGRLLQGHRDNLGILSRSGKHLAELIDDVLEMSKIEAGQTMLAKTSFDLHLLLDDVEEMIRPRAEKRDLQLVFDLGPGLPKYIHTDGRRLRQILINLLGNAVKYTDKGRVTLRVRFRKGADTGLRAEPTPLGRLDPSVRLHSAQEATGCLDFEIEDTGIGIAQEDLERIFEPFVQLNPGQEATEGAGLGLALARRFVALLGGELTVSSQTGKGSIFEFEIDVELPEGSVAGVQTLARRVIGLAPGQPLYRVLVVDDSGDSRSILRQLLEQTGFSVLEATNGQEGVDLYEGCQPNLIWMDLRMPVMDGHEAARRIREIEGGRRSENGERFRTPMIALTAGVMDNEASQALSGAFDDFLRKPFQAAEIFDKMEKHLGVRFVYEQSDLSSAKEVEIRDAEALTPAVLSVLPADWLRDFSRALKKGWSAELLSLIDLIRPDHADLAQALVQLVRVHRYDKLISVTEAALKGSLDG